MTAAVARPPLFRHLVASNPEQEKGSVAATVSSVALHAAIVVAAVVLTARVQAPAEKVDITEIVRLTDFPTEARVSTGGGGARASSPTAPTPPVDVGFVPPIDVPKDIPPSGSMDGLMKALEQMMATQPKRGVAAGPAEGAGANPGDFVPVTVKPELLNRAEIVRSMQRLYPQTLLEAGVGGTVLVWLHLDENASVIETRIRKGSGFNLLDEAALKVAQTARFSPAYNRDQRVRVWVELPVLFGAR
jgi:TonB family protein